MHEFVGTSTPFSYRTRPDDTPYGRATGLVLVN